MSKRFAIRMSLAPCLLIVCISLTIRSGEPAWADPGIGFADVTGRFVPKARVSKDHSRIVISKLQPDEKLGSIEIRFLARKVEPKFSAAGIFLQWQKSDGPGKLWPLEGQKSFDKTTGIYRGTWNSSASFSIVDKSGLGIFEKHPWHRLVELRINGKSLHPKKAREYRHPVVTSPPAVAMKVAADREVGTAPQAAAPRVISRAPAGTDQTLSTDDYREKYHQLLERTEELERSLDSLRKRSYLGSALFALLGGVLAGVGLFLTLFLPRRRVRNGASAPTVFGKLRLHPAYKAQRAG